MSQKRGPVDLTGQRVLVIGGSSGIGLGVAQAALEAGAEVVIAGSTPAKVEAVVAEMGEGARGLVVDLREPASIEALADAIEPIDHLAITAKPGAVGSVPAMSTEEAMASIEGSFWTAYRAIRALLPKIKEHPQSSVTLTSGGFAQRPSKGYSIYTISHLANEGLARALALEIKPIRANAVRPGMVDTPLWASMPAEMKRAMFAEVASSLPSGRVAQPRDLGLAFVHLMANSFVTGSVIDVDGGGAIV